MTKFDLSVLRLFIQWKNKDLNIKKITEHTYNVKHKLTGIIYRVNKYHNTVRILDSE